MTSYKIVGEGNYVFDTRDERDSTPEELEADQRHWCAVQLERLEDTLEDYNDEELARMRELVERESTRRKNPAAL
jgi:hypothetical protein